MLFGIAARIWGILLFGDMLVAILSVNWANGLIAEKAAGGYEINLALGALALTVTLLGAGGWSLDRLFGLEHKVGIDRWSQRARRARPQTGARQPPVPAATADTGSLGTAEPAAGAAENATPDG